LFPLWTAERGVELPTQQLNPYIGHGLPAERRMELRPDTTEWESMRHQLDHVFICCAVDAPEASALARLGIREGSPNTHPGQGTACRRFFFRNAYLELLWVRDADEARDASSVRTRLWERWSGRRSGACPFGVVLRPKGTGRAESPFPCWSYHPPYLPPDIAIDVAIGTRLSEPELFYWGHPRRPDDMRGESTEHAVPLRDMTRVSVGIPGAATPTAAARAAGATGLIAFASAPEHVMQLEFDGAARGGAADLRPELPLVLQW
jgi:hypothetical protein